MIAFEIYAPGKLGGSYNPSVCVEYITHDEMDFMEIDEQILAMFLGYS